LSKKPSSKAFLFFSMTIAILCIILVSRSFNNEQEEVFETKIVSVVTEHLPELTEKLPELASQLPVKVAAVDSSALIGSLNFLTKTEPVHTDHILELYRQSESRACVIEFFAGVCGSKEIAEIILASTDEFDISPALAFALSWQESRFDPKAVNKANRNGSVDRGLFQLNNKSFPGLETADFFNPQINAHNAMKHLRSCIKSGGNEIGALAVYNAGIGRVNRNGAPWVTLDYIGHIEENIERIESHFLEWEACFIKKPVQPEVVTIEIIREIHEHHRLPVPKLSKAHRKDMQH
jgi:hypothetical protein